MMQLKSAQRRWLQMTMLGAIVWGLIVVYSLFLPSNGINDIELLLLFGVSLITPLAMRIVVQENRDDEVHKVVQFACWLHPLSILAVSIIIAIPPSLITSALASIWLLQTLLFFLYGLWRLLQRPILAVEEMSIDAGLAYMPISGIWLFAYASNFPLLTFDKTFVLLTAVHFTFISAGALIIIGMVGRQLVTSTHWRTYSIGACLAIASPLLVAFGISLTQFSGRLWLEVGSVITLATSFLLLAIIGIFKGLPQNKLSRLLILLASLSLGMTMSLALMYSIGRFSGNWIISLDTMVQWHGWFNAVGFTFLGLVAWNIETPQTLVSPSGIPFSQLPWRYTIGASFFDDIGATDLHPTSVPTGIVDDLTIYQQDGFEVNKVLPEITNFYEQTATHDLLVYPEWKFGFGGLSRIYKQISTRMGQMNFPIEPDSNETSISSTIVPLKDDLDRRDNVRGWVRVYSENGKAVYVAAYSSHCYNDHRYMNIAFPLPFGNLTSILRLETLDSLQGGLLLTSFSKRNQDQGVYFANALCHLRLPINETIRVHSANDLYEEYPDNFPIGNVVAEHKMWIFGIHCLTLHYSIQRE